MASLDFFFCDLLLTLGENNTLYSQGFPLVILGGIDSDDWDLVGFTAIEVDSDSKEVGKHLPIGEFCGL